MMNSNLTIGGLLATGLARLRAAPATAGPAGTPLLDAEVLLAHVLGTSRARLKSHPEEVPTADRARHYAELIERRAAGEPLAYIVGAKDFWSLRLAVSPAVLVPRPETELLVERALTLRAESSGSVADLGTGSGSIALALASERPHWRIVATDVSEAALSIARSNAAALQLTQVEFLQGNWLEPLAGRRFDLILSNPPYIAASDAALLQPALTHEPRLALTPGADAMACLREIILCAPHYLERRGWILLEHGADQAAEVRDALVLRGFSHVRSHRDLAGRDRMSEAQWPGAQDDPI